MVYFKTSRLLLILVISIRVFAQPSTSNSENPKGGGEFSRAIVGFEQSGASSAPSTQRFFSDLYISVPFPVFRRQHADNEFGPRLRLWGNVRVTTVPQQISTPVAQFATEFVNKVGEIKVNELAQAAEFLAGVDFRLFKSDVLLPSFDRKTQQKFSFSFIAGGGAITPLTPRDTIQVFKVSPDASARYGDGLKDKDFVAFVSSDRDRFFRQYYVGIGLRTFYYQNGEPQQRFPATLDLTYGVNESVTRGRLRGGVIRLEGFYPLPWDTSKFIFLFGTALLKPSRSTISDPLVLEPAPAGTPVPGPRTAIVTVQQADRDYYRIGVGIDMIGVIKRIADRTKPEGGKKSGGGNEAAAPPKPLEPGKL